MEEWHYEWLNEHTSEHTNKPTSVHWLRDIQNQLSSPVNGNRLNEKKNWRQQKRLTEPFSQCRSWFLGYYCFKHFHRLSFQFIIQKKINVVNFSTWNDNNLGSMDHGHCQYLLLFVFLKPARFSLFSVCLVFSVVVIDI